MFNPKEAAEDSHALNLAILVLAAFAVLLSIYFHHDSGLKFWLLKGFGESSRGLVLSVQKVSQNPGMYEEIFRDNPRNALKNYKAWSTGDILVAEFKPGDSPLQIISFKMPTGYSSTRDSDTLFITYLPINPRIAHPTDYLADFALDGRILLWSLVLGAAIALLAVRSVQKWMGFRNQMRRY
ncbi:MAG: hypothetical protein K5905_18585 [Roseibium sp.]|uniref:hypothetical protein n=1 Tax=Roseibium sp. TaxID=1936156 RepID=UPI002603D1F4|nr:hypothetical protein [Roseibium sp.]MCV0427470.1 hypothetical protein [Roseibium sp.]